MLCTPDFKRGPFQVWPARIFEQPHAKLEREQTRAGGINLRFGDISVPHLPNDEPLKLECKHFVECILERKQPISDGQDGLRVVRAIDALQRSLDTGGQSVSLRMTHV